MRDGGYIDPESGLRISPLDTATALMLVERLPCLVNLLPHFRRAAIQKLELGEADTYLVSASDPSAEFPAAMLLYTRVPPHPRPSRRDPQSFSAVCDLRARRHH